MERANCIPFNVAQKQQFWLEKEFLLFFFKKPVALLLPLGYKAY